MISFIRKNQCQDFQLVNNSIETLNLHGTYSDL